VFFVCRVSACFISVRPHFILNKSLTSLSLFFPTMFCIY
jgi:hypothetical protein